MATLLAVAHHRNEYHIGYGKGDSPARFGSSSRGFMDVNCRGVEAGRGLLPIPFRGYGSPVSNRGVLSEKPENLYVGVGGKSPFGSVTGVRSKSEDIKQSKKVVKSSPIAINLKGGSGSSKKKEVRENVCFSELWAGPAYSNSPPPTSLPMPKFDMKPKRSVSLDLPDFVSDLNMSPMAMSAPTSPTSKSDRSSNGFFSDDDSATKTLRRILNLDIADD
ncbi:uncharacterized protein LOC141652997 [Silene latifolia]|uniref:uncharacterized protein LOC141652997 n=1 Tax=Silene latifolia TaxID=37657 RepID=UPI003D77952D